MEYLYSGKPEQADIPLVMRAPASGQSVPVQQPAPPQIPTAAGGPNANPLDIFPQRGLPDVGGNAAGAGNLDFPRNSQQIFLEPVQDSQSLKAPATGNGHIRYRSPSAVELLDSSGQCEICASTEREETLR